MTPPQSLAGAASCRILHLEDSPIDAELIAEHLAEAGIASRIQVVPARAPYVAALHEGGFDLILADYVLPDFDGLAALALARDLVPDIPFIFVSGTLGEEAAVDAVRAGATDYVVKHRLARLPIAIGRALREAETRAGQRQAVAALRDSEMRLRLALHAGRLGSWELDLRSMTLQASETCRGNYGLPPEAPFGFEMLRRVIHPDDLPLMEAGLARSVTDGVDFDVEYRVTWPDGSIHWVEVRGQPVLAANGTPVGLAGVSLDVTERKLAEQRRTLLSREVDHRAKNALAVVQATLRLTRAKDVEGYVRAVEGRVAALARAHTLLAENRWAGTDLRALLAGELSPFLGDGGARAVLEGPDISLPAGAAQPLAMAIHELATNATKYGALSREEGRVTVTWAVEHATLVRLRWQESGGPPVLAQPKRRGFGGRVLDGTVRVQLGGKVELAWQPVGLVCDIEVPLGPVAEPAEAG